MEIQESFLENGMQAALTAQDKLKPCPFCGGNELTLTLSEGGFYYLGCADCSAAIPGFAGINDLKVKGAEAHSIAGSAAIEAWNTRPDPV